MQRTYIIAGIIGAVVVIGTTFLSFGISPGGRVAQSATATTATTATTLTPDAVDSVVIPPGYIEYRNAKYGFSFFHPPEGLVEEYDEGGGSMTITVEDTKEMRGFQIFIVPYAEETISEERFKADVPSGVRANVEDITIDGIHSVAFDSFDQFLGETKEIWLVHRGYLFEVTTLRSLDAWVAEIMATWRFDDQN